jgi:hypothetical protein
MMIRTVPDQNRTSSRRLPTQTEPYEKGLLVVIPRTGQPAIQPSEGRGMIQGKGMIQINNEVIPFEMMDGEASQRFSLRSREPVRVKIESNGWRPGAPVTVSTPDGGRVVVEGEAGPLVPASNHLSVSFSFEPGRDRGHYVVEFKQEGTSLLVPFWHGTPPPLGRAPEVFPTQLTHLPPEPPTP